MLARARRSPRATACARLAANPPAPPRTTAHRTLARIPTLTSDLPPDLLVAASLGYADEPAQSQTQLAEQLRARGLFRHQPAALEAFCVLDRAPFAPRRADGARGTAADELAAYRDEPLAIGCAAHMSAPSAHARLLELAAEFLAPAAGGATPRAAVRLLDVGSGAGYLTAGLALVAHLSTEGASVAAVGVDSEAALVDRARASVRAAGLRLASQSALDGQLDRGSLAERLLAGPSEGFLRFVCADALREEDVSPLGPFDLIVCGGGVVEEPPRALTAALARGGRLIAPMGAAGAAQRLCLVDKLADGELAPPHALETVAFAPLVPAASSDSSGEPAPSARLEDVQKELRSWQARFKAANGGERPSRDLMLSDPEARSLLDRLAVLGRGGRR